LVQDITPTMQNMIFKTNSGEKHTSHKAMAPNYGEE